MRKGKRVKGTVEDSKSYYYKVTFTRPHTVHNTLCKHTHTHTCTDMPTHSCTNTHTPLQRHTYTPAKTHPPTPAKAHPPTPAYIDTPTHLHRHIHTLAQTHPHTCTDTPTHLHSHLLKQSLYCCEATSKGTKTHFKIQFWNEEGASFSLPGTTKQFICSFHLKIEYYVM